MISRRFLSRVLSVVGAVGLVSAACAPLAPQAGSTPVEQVSARLDFSAYGGSAFWIVAKEKGYFKDENLDVTIGEGKSGLNVIQTVASGADHFSFNSPDVLLKARSEGIPVKMIAGIYDGSPQGILCHTAANVKTPKDLEGKTYAATPGDVSTAVLPALMQIHKADFEKIRQIKMDSGAKNQAYLANQVDCVSSFYNSSYVVLGQQTKDVTFLRFKDQGLNTIGYRLFASEDYMKNKPKVVAGFTRATLKGVQYMREHPDEAAQLLVKNYPDLKIAVVQGQVKNSLELFDDAAIKAKGYGYQDQAAYEKLNDLLVQSGLLTKKVDVSKAFTNEFIK